eukprot:CAMPEP_0114130986 /NCGR_PEP_ID=MMETSP0043_2-20121206/12309_1 /TAXON_ID=464988 /ORGANISM="Hemiselmis andersenii, Strain CCMP644" /LENGTH=429 /DNA_ID=CAMNT_0001224381 /DNA_START=227 /DNA_END=1513 /DNA_ORIENTATION=+
MARRNSASAEVEDLSASLPNIWGKHRKAVAVPRPGHQPQGRPADDLDSIRYCGLVRAEHASSLGDPESTGLLEERKQRVQQAAKPAQSEDAMGEAEREIATLMRSQLTAVRVDPTEVLRTLSRLIDYFLVEIQTKDDAHAGASAEYEQRLEDAASEIARLKGELADLEAARQEVERRVLEEQGEKQTLKETIKEMEGVMKDQAEAMANAEGISAEDLARLKVQLSKARASAEASRKQAEEMQEKMLAAERAKRQEEATFREKRGQIERELKEFKDNFGPEKVNELRSQLEEAMTELDQVKDQLRKNKMAGRQQHKLVVEWKIKVHDIELKLTEQNTTIHDQEEELEKRGTHIADLKATVAQLQQDIKKTQSLLNQTNSQLTDYVEKYTRQTAYVKQQEGMWKAMQAKQRLLLSQTEDGGPPPSITSHKT